MAFEGDQKCTTSFMLCLGCPVRERPRLIFPSGCRPRRAAHPGPPVTPLRCNASPNPIAGLRICWTLPVVQRSLTRARQLPTPMLNLSGASRRDPGHRGDHPEAIAAGPDPDPLPDLVLLNRSINPEGRSETCSVYARDRWNLTPRNVRISCRSVRPELHGSSGAVRAAVKRYFWCLISIDAPTAARGTVRRLALRSIQLAFRAFGAFVQLAAHQRNPRIRRGAP